jgi:hypothetical protein
MEEITYNDIIEKLLPYKDNKVQITATKFWNVDENTFPGGNEVHEEIRFFDEDDNFIVGVKERYNKETFETIGIKMIEP